MIDRANLSLDVTAAEVAYRHRLGAATREHHPSSRPRPWSRLRRNAHAAG